MRQQLSLNPRPLLCLCLFQILFQWELSRVVRWVPPFCCLCFYWHSPSSSTANAKEVSGSLKCVCMCVCVCVCVCVCARDHTHAYSMCLSVFLSSARPIRHSASLCLKKGTYASCIAFYSNEINEYSCNMANGIKTPTACFCFILPTWNCMIIF